MNPALLKALVALVAVGALVAWSTIALRRRKTVFGFLQLLGAGCLVVVVLTHVAEAVHILPSMRWGEPDSAGHYLDLASAILGLTLLSIAVVLRGRERSSEARNRQT